MARSQTGPAAKTSDSAATTGASPRRQSVVGPLAKRLFDIALSGAAMIALLPLFAAVSAAIRLSSRGPILFRQMRVGKDGDLFELLKFRTMHLTAEDPVETWARDPRVFRIGRWLREFHVDELPQLWNVLRGDMSVVGPRPALPAQVARYTEEQRERLNVRPGLTGLAQVSGNNLLEWDARIEVDREYVRSQNMLLDLRILWRTPFVVLRRYGVYGAGGRTRDKS